MGRMDEQNCHKHGEKIRLMTEGLDESSKQLTLWIIGFSVALGLSVVFIITTCIFTILRKKSIKKKIRIDDKQPCLTSATTTEQPGTSNMGSNYQEIITDGERDTYESILLK